MLVTCYVDDGTPIRSRLGGDQCRVFDKVIERINDNKVIRMFVSGTAGTGKSFLIKALIDAIGYEHVFVCAPTGLAAKLINGKTIHSFFNMPIVVQAGECFLKLIIIDEISMCSASMLDKIEEKLSSTRPNNGPFGGYSVIMFGDLLQIPPVEAEWVFESKWWHLFEYAELLANHRQQLDCEFADMLMRWRVGRLSSSDIKFLESRVIKSTKQSQLDKIADAFINIEKGNSMILVHSNWMADGINKRIIDQKFGNTSQNVTDVHHHIDSGKITKNIISRFKIGGGAKVMINQNLKCGLKNGEVAKIIQIHAKNNIIERVDVMPTSNHILFTLHRLVKNEIVTPKKRKATLYLPFIPAYAVTYHKSQGQTLDCVVLDLKTNMDACMFFVGASRVRRREDFYITALAKGFSIQINNKARNEYNRLRSTINLPPIQ